MFRSNFEFENSSQIIVDIIHEISRADPEALDKKAVPTPHKDRETIKKKSCADNVLYKITPRPDVSNSIMVDMT